MCLPAISTGNWIAAATACPMKSWTPLMDSFRIQQTFTGSIDLVKDNAEIYTTGDGGMPHPSHETDFLSRILEFLNETYGVNLSDDDKVDLERIKIKLESNDELRSVFTGNNTLEAIRYKFNQAWTR